MYCQSCGTQNSDDAKYCSNCGKPFCTPKNQTPKKKIGKRILIICLVVFAVFWLIGTLGNSSDTAAGKSGTSSVNAKNAESNKPEGTIGDYVVTVKEATVVQSTLDGKDILVVTYSFANNSKDPKAFLYAITDKLFQNGVEIQSVLTSFGIEDYYSFDNKSKEIKPGVTLDVQNAYELSDTSTPVEVEISEWISFSNDKITYTIDLSEPS